MVGIYSNPRNNAVVDQLPASAQTMFDMGACRDAQQLQREKMRSAEFEQMFGVKDHVGHMWLAFVVAGEDDLYDKPGTRRMVHVDLCGVAYDAPSALVELPELGPMRKRIGSAGETAKSSVAVTFVESPRLQLERHAMGNQYPHKFMLSRTTQGTNRVEPLPPYRGFAFFDKGSPPEVCPLPEYCAGKGSFHPDADSKKIASQICDDLFRRGFVNLNSRSSANADSRPVVCYKPLLVSIIAQIRREEKDEQEGEAAPSEGTGGDPCILQVFAPEDERHVPKRVRQHLGKTGFFGGFTDQDSAKSDILLSMKSVGAAAAGTNQNFIPIPATYLRCVELNTTRKSASAMIRTHAEMGADVLQSLQGMNAFAAGGALVEEPDAAGILRSFAKNDVVRLHSLAAKPELNGRTATVQFVARVDSDLGLQRYNVVIDGEGDGGAAISVAGKNLKLLEDAQSQTRRQKKKKKKPMSKTETKETAAIMESPAGRRFIQMVRTGTISATELTKPEYRAIFRWWVGRHDPDEDDEEDRGSRVILGLMDRYPKEFDDFREKIWLRLRGHGQSLGGPELIRELAKNVAYLVMLRTLMQKTPFFRVRSITEGSSVARPETNLLDTLKEMEWKMTGKHPDDEGDVSEQQQQQRPTTGPPWQPTPGGSSSGGPGDEEAATLISGNGTALPDDEVGRLVREKLKDPEITKKGLAKAMELSEGKIAKLLRRAKDAGFLQEDGAVAAEYR